MSGHSHADLMAKAAEIAKTDKEWWEHFEIRITENGETTWKGFVTSFTFDSYSEYREKPRYIDIGGHQVPEPVRFPLEIGQKYWVADIANPTDEWLWDDDERDGFLLERGLIHLTQEAAEVHIAALLSFTQK